MIPIPLNQDTLPIIFFKNFKEILDKSLKNFCQIHFKFAKIGVIMKKEKNIFQNFNFEKKFQENLENKNPEKKLRKNKKLNRTYKQLVYEERCVIEKMCNAGFSKRKIAKTLGRSPNTVSQELVRNQVCEKYKAEKAKIKSYQRRWQAKAIKCNKVKNNKKLEDFVIEKTESYWSPERISKRVQLLNLSNVSAKSIRKYIKYHKPYLLTFLHKNRVHKKSGRKIQKYKIKLSNRKFIDQRNLDFPLFTCEFGHWEGDFIVSRKSKTVLFVLVEKKSKFVLLKKLEKRKNNIVNNAVFSLLKNQTIKSLTLDNDIAFQKHKQLEKRIQAPVYFCEPYSSWQKGLVENMNLQIRQFILKKTDISQISDLQIQIIQNWLNNTPRQCLNAYTALEKLFQFEFKLFKPVIIQHSWVKKRIQKIGFYDKLVFNRRFNLLSNLVFANKKVWVS